MISKARRNWMAELADREAERGASGFRQGSLGREDNLAQAVRELLDENAELRIALRGLALDLGPRLDNIREMLLEAAK